MKTTYKVSKGGVLYGEYEADSPQDALRAFAAEAGGAGTEMALSYTGFDAVPLKPSSSKSRARSWFEKLNPYQAAAVGAAVAAFVIAAFEWLR